MNKNKIHSSLLNEVNTLNNKAKQIIITSNNFLKTKHFLQNNGYIFTPYRFANCFSVLADVETIKTLSTLNYVTYISPNTEVQTLNNGKDITNFNNWTNKLKTNSNCTICFIDTGIYPHLDFILPYNRIIKFVDFINNNTHPYDDNGHGTFVCGVACGNGIISKQNKGYAANAKIVSIKALNKNGSSSANTILDAMQWVFENHKVYNISVVCMSFGADYEHNNDPLYLGSQALWKCGIIVVAAAGNSGPKSNTIKSPGINPNIITVGALDTEKLNVADYSSRGPTCFGNKPDLLAPASNMISCNINRLPYTTMSGTSVATPVVAGICAIIKSKYKNFSNNQIKSYILSHCKKINGDKNSEGNGYIYF